MSRPPKGDVDVFRYSLRMPPASWNLFSKAIELGLVKDARSKREAIERLVDLYFRLIHRVYQLYEKNGVTDAPVSWRDEKFFQVALSAPEADEILELTADVVVPLIYALAPHIGTPEFKEFITELRKYLREKHIDVDGKEDASSESRPPKEGR